MPNRYKGFFLILIFLAGIVLGIPFLFSKMIHEDSDVYGRSNMSTYERLNRDELFNFDPNRYGMWLPLHSKILGLSLAIYDNVFFSPRFMTLVFSAGTAVLMYYYAFLITGSARISILSSLLFLFLPQRIFLSTLTFSEPIFGFFLISALILIFKTPPNYWAGLVLLNIASGIRYESWFLLPFIWLTIWRDCSLKFKFRPMVILETSIFPIFWLLINGMTTGNLLRFLVDKYGAATEGSNRDNPAFGNFPLAFSNWSGQLSEVITVLGIALIVYGWYCLIKTKNDWKKHVLLLLPVWLFFLLPLQVFLKTMEFFPARYLFIPMTLAFPLLAYGIVRFKSKLKLSSIIKRFPLYRHLILLVGAIFSLQLYINSARNYNDYKRFYDENPELSAAVDIIKAKSSTDPSLTASYYHNDDPRDRSWLEEYIIYFSRYYNFQQFSKRELRDRLVEGDIVVLENAKDNQSEKIYFELLSPYYKLENMGKLISIYSVIN